MSEYMKLTIVGLKREDASAIVGLIPGGCTFTLTNENGEKKNRRRQEGLGTRKAGLTIYLLKMLSNSTTPLMKVELAKRLAEKWGAKNPGAAVHGLVRAGYVEKNADGTKIKLTAAGEARSKEAR